MLLVAAALAGTIAVGAAGEAARPKGPGPGVLTDSRYVRLANAECSATLPGLRPADSGPFGQAIPPVQTAAQIDRAAAGLDSLADRLRALPASGGDVPHVEAWLEGWHRYAERGRQYAIFLRERGNANPGSLLADSVSEARAADDFALANKLGSCAFFATPQPDPSNGF